MFLSGSDMPNIPFEEVVRRIEESTKFSIADFLLLGNTWNFIDIGGDIPAFEWLATELDYEKLFAGVFELQDTDFRLAVKLGNVSGCELLLFVTSSSSMPSDSASVNGPHEEVDVDAIIRHLRLSFEEVVKESCGETQTSFDLNGSDGMSIFAADWNSLGDAFGRRLSSPDFFAEDMYPRGSRAYFAARKIGATEEWNTATDIHCHCLPRIKPQNAIKKYVRVAMDHVLENGHLWFPERHVDTRIGEAVNVGLLNGCSNRYYRQLVGETPIVALQQTYMLFEGQFATTLFFRKPSVAKDLLHHLARNLAVEGSEVETSSTLKDMDVLQKRVDSVERAVEAAFSPGRNHATRTILVYSEDCNHSLRMADLFWNAELAARRFAVRHKMLSGLNYNITPLLPYVTSLLEVTRKLFQTVRMGIEEFKAFLARPRAVEEREIEDVSSLISETAADIYVSESLLRRALMGKFADGSDRILEPYLDMNRMTAVGLCSWPFSDDAIWWNDDLGKVCTSVQIADLIGSLSNIFADYCHRARILEGSWLGAAGVIDSSQCSSSEDQPDGIIFNAEGTGKNRDDSPITPRIHHLPGQQNLFTDLPINFVPLRNPFPNSPLEPEVIIHHAAQHSMVNERGELVLIRTVTGSFHTRDTNDGITDNSERTVRIEEVSDEEEEEVTVSATQPQDGVVSHSRNSSDPTYEEVAVESVTPSMDVEDEVPSVASVSCVLTLWRMIPGHTCRKKADKLPREKKAGRFRRACRSFFKKICCL